MTKPSSDEPPPSERPADCLVTHTNEVGEAIEWKGPHYWHWVAGTEMQKRQCSTCGKTEQA